MAGAPATVSATEPTTWAGPLAGGAAGAAGAAGIAGAAGSTGTEGALGRLTDGAFGVAGATGAGAFGTDFVTSAPPCEGALGVGVTFFATSPAVVAGASTGCATSFAGGGALVLGAELCGALVLGAEGFGAGALGTEGVGADGAETLGAETFGVETVGVLGTDTSGSAARASATPDATQTIDTAAAKKNFFEMPGTPKRVNARKSKPRAWSVPARCNSLTDYPAEAPDQAPVVAFLPGMARASPQITSIRGAFSALVAAN